MARMGSVGGPGRGPRVVAMSGWVDVLGLAAVAAMFVVAVLLFREFNRARRAADRLESALATLEETMEAEGRRKSTDEE